MVIVVAPRVDIIDMEIMAPSIGIILIGVKPGETKN
jgi:hypothetical protein